MDKEYSERARKDLIQIGINIASLRRNQKMSQETLAEKAGLSTIEISLIESKNVDNVSSMEVLFNIAAALGVSMDELFAETSVCGASKK